MSQTTMPPPMPTVTDRVVNASRDLPELLNRAAALDPETAAKWTGGALVASKTVWGTLAALVVAEGVRRLHLGWDQNTIAVVSGALVLAAAAGLRLVTKYPITGFFRKATVAEVVAKVTP